MKNTDIQTNVRNKRYTTWFVLTEVICYLGGVSSSVEAVPKALCTNMVAINQDFDLQENQDHQKASCYNQIKAIPG